MYKKHISDYSILQHYGCSFTFGEDSGGDNINDDSLSYPAHLSRLLGNLYVNKGKRASSNSSIFYKLYNDIENSQIAEDTLVVVNLTNSFRYSLIKEWNRPCDKLSTFLQYNNETYRVLNFNSNHLVNSNVDVTHIFELPDYYFTLESMRSIYSIIGLLNKYEIPYIFLNMLLNKSDSDLAKFTLNPLHNLVSKVPEKFRSSSNHFTSKGYKILANNVYEIIKDIKC